MKKSLSKSNKIEELLNRGVEEIIDRSRLENKLKSEKQLRIKFGIDPTGQNIHLGTSVPLLKLRDFQELGHKVVLIIGDFTGLIGDTSDKDSERPMLSEETVKENLKTYTKQAAKIIDIDTVEIYYNSKWLAKLGYMDIGRQADVFSLNKFISRENISRRLENGKRVSLRELLYPLMQGYDSVEARADVEIGGTDQRFNLLAGRDIQRFYGQEPQDILTNPLIEGLDGRKMSSSFGNIISLFDTANDMFGKIMSLKDDLIIKYFILFTRVEIKTIDEYKTYLKEGANPRDIKMKLALEIVRMYHSKKDADKAQENFVKLVQNKEATEDIPEVFLGKSVFSLLELLRQCLEEDVSNSEIKRLIQQNSIKIDGQTRNDPNTKIEISRKGNIVKVGKKKWFKVNP